jgi:cytochrome c2
VRVAALAALLVLPFSAWADDAGERAFQHCYSCHSLDPAETHLQGPVLKGIIGRAIAAQPGFRYSDALRRFAAANPAWTRALLESYIADPERLVPGTDMAMPRIRDTGLRRAILDHLAASAGR